MNAPMREGAGYVNMTITREGTRVNAARAFLRPALARENLTLLVGTDVAQLTFEGTRCTGVRIVDKSGARTIRAGREVLVTAGGMTSARLLLLSGIGDADASRRLGIAPVARSPGRRPQLPGPSAPVRHGLSLQGQDAAAIDDEQCGGGRRLSAQRPGLAQPRRQDGADAAALHDAGGPGALRALPSDGYHARPSADAPHQPRLAIGWRAPTGARRRCSTANFLSTDHDIDTIVRAIEMCRELGSQPAFAPIRDDEIMPGRTLDQGRPARLRPQRGDQLRPSGRHLQDGNGRRWRWSIRNCASTASRACASAIPR